MARPPLAVVFGIVDDAGAVIPAIEVPLFGGSTFGWRLQLGCEGEIAVREELRLPAPGDWGPDPDLQISQDQRTAVQIETLRCVDGWISRTWTVSPGDPPGEWLFRVTAAGFARQTFRAAFVRPPSPP